MNKTPEQLFADKFLEMSPEEFNEWADKASLEEVAHATTLIRIANTQLRAELEGLECVAEEQEYIEWSLEDGYFPEAEEVLSKFTLKGSN